MPTYADVRLETSRLVLRPFRHADAADLFKVYADPQVFRHIPIGDWKDLDEAHQRIARDINTMAEGGYVRLAVERREDARVLGEVLLFKFDLPSRRAEIGYALASDAWGCGYVAEALPPLVQFGFHELGLNRLEAVIDPRNAASEKVIRRLGFTHEGTFREHHIIRGEAVDSAVWALLRREWDSGTRP
ncbi:GNAT family N-acetyltransferase [Ramlibacter sp. PS4R-6]|uniref:GNAT family N-acetyltransferase n=1 Tax=Ramlibacter sp. PS4R-6 TaxID=3133438 RepID=UPI0030B5BBB9